MEQFAFKTARLVAESEAARLNHGAPMLQPGLTVPRTTDSRGPIRIILVKRAAMLRELVTMILGATEGISVCGAVGDGREGLELICHHRPEVVLMDLGLPSMTGLEVASAVRARGIASRFLLVSDHCTMRLVQQVKHAAVAGFLDKEASGLQILMTAISEVAAGRVYFSDQFRYLEQQLRRSPQSFLPLLSAREQEILDLIVLGRNDASIADSLGLSRHTVFTHRTNIRRKLRQPDTPSLIAFAIGQGFGLHRQS